MASTGNKFPTVGANVDRAGNTAWTSPGNVTADDTTDTTVVVPSDYLVTSGYDFTTIPSNVAIRGFVVRVEASESGTGSSTYVAQLHTATTPTLVGNAISAVTVNGTTKVISSNGSIADLWGTTLTAAQVKNSGFGVSVWSTDTINTLAIDYVTIDVTWTDVPNAWDAQQYYRRRKNTTHRRRLEAPLNDLNPATPSSSVDRALEAPFRTVTIRSRRAKSAGWIAALAAAPVAVVPAVSAWLTPVAHKRRETERRLLVVDHAVIERYTPPAIAWFAPKVIKVDFRRKLQAPAPQLLFPPTTGPPVEYYPAWATRPLPATYQDRQHLKSDDAPVYPETPKPEPNLCARIPTGFNKRRETKRRLLTVELDSYPAPQAPAASADRTLEQPFRTRRIRSRKFLKAPALISAGVATPGTSDAPLPAWAEQRANYRPSHRTLRRVAQLDTFPATPAPPGVTIPAVTLTKVKRRKHRQGLFLSGGGVVEAPATATYPAYVPTGFNRRRDTTRRLQRVAHSPSYPAAAAVAQPISAWIATVAQRTSQKRTLLTVPPPPATPLATSSAPITAWTAPKVTRVTRKRTAQSLVHAVFPQTPAIGAQPESAWLAQKANWIERRRTLQQAAAQITYPATPQVQEPPESAWLNPKQHRIERKRTLQKAAPQLLHPVTPFRDVGAITLELAQKRRETRRTLRTALHGPQYKVTPVITAPFVAWKLATAFRRNGWKRLQVVPLLLEHPVSTDRGYLVGIVRVTPALLGALGSSISIEPALDGAPRLRPDE